MSQLLSPPLSPRDPRHYVPRRPSPLSLPPLAPHLAFTSSSNNFQSFSLSAFAIETPKTGAKIPRYPLEKQRRALKELEQEQYQLRNQQQMEGQAPMQIPQVQLHPPADPSPTTTLPLTPRSSASTVSKYSQHDDEDEDNGKSKRNTSFCASVFGSCFGGLRSAAATKDDSVPMRPIRSAR